ncbi:TIGR01777 family oxidoreductase [Fontimonas sp. SYSU GA230001]|uniref:TIGR01777 family oxidoreductase n=1 Tax=Fontimonas sp. SYSU GA230001 TaxID=3142450 RepID=UPI0032B403C8
MRVLVTGATGFIGRALCGALLARGDAVVALTRSLADARAVLPAPVACVTALDDAGATDAVVNLAGLNLASGRWTAARKQAMVASRVQTTEGLVAWMQAGVRPRVLVSGSAIGWYGARGDEPLAEDAAPGRSSEFSVQLCTAWEAAAARAAALGVRTCLLRTGIVLEGDGGSLARMLLPFRLGLGGPMGSGRQWMSWIHRADLVALILWLIDRDDASGPYNGTAPEPVRHAEFVAALGRVLHRPAIVPMPGFVLRLLIGEMADLLLTGQKVLPVRALDGGFTFAYPRLDAALQAILGGDKRRAVQ